MSDWNARRRLLLLSEEDALTILYCASRSGYSVCVAGLPARNRTIAHHPLCDRFIPLTHDLVDADDGEPLIQQLERVIREEQIDVLMPSSFNCIKLVARHRDRLRRLCAVMPTASIDTILELDNKASFFEFCQRFRLAHPESVYVEDAAALERLQLDADFFPALWKPVWGAGEKLLRFDDPADLDRHRERLLGDVPRYFPALIQRYFDGEDIDFNGFALDGRVVASSVMRTTDVQTPLGSYRLTDFVAQEEVDRLGRAIVAHAGFTGPLNIDMRISARDGRVYLIEVNPRFWDRTAMSLIDDINFVAVGMQLAAGETPSASSRMGDACWISPPSGLLKSLLSFDGRAPKLVRRISREQVKMTAFDAYASTYARLRRLRRSATTTRRAAPPVRGQRLSPDW